VPANSVDDFLARRFLFVTGKGGVGKTTVVAALAETLRASRQTRAGRRDQPEGARLDSVRSRVAADADHRAVAAGFGVLLDADVALKEYGAIVLKSERLVGALFDNKLVRGFFHGAPGLKEWAALGKAWYHSTEVLADGSPRFDVVILDAPAPVTASTCCAYRRRSSSSRRRASCRTDAERAWAQFRDPAQSGVIVVNLPEEMPTNESLELCAVCRASFSFRSWRWSSIRSYRDFLRQCSATSSPTWMNRARPMQRRKRSAPAFAAPRASKFKVRASRGSPP